METSEIFTKSNFLDAFRKELWKGMTVTDLIFNVNFILIFELLEKHSGQVVYREIVGEVPWLNLFHSRA